MQTLSEFVEELRGSLPVFEPIKTAKKKRARKPKLIIERDQNLQAPIIQRIVPSYPVGTLFNIYKRAVPFADGPLNKMVLLGLTRAEADIEVVKLIRKEQTRRNADETNVFFMYDIVPMEPKNGEHSPFYNEGSPVL